MAKKIYDIVPPKAAQRTTPIRRTVRSPRARKPVETRILRQAEEKKKRSLKREFMVGGGVALLILGIYFYNSLQRATVDIWPVTEQTSQQDTITADKAASSVSVTDKVIPATFLEQDASGSQQFPATGASSSDSKASGTITVYNNISPATSLTLRQGTHFLSDSGKYFISQKTISVPAAKGKTAGSIDVQVVAEASGSDSNIGPSKFSVPKLYGTSYYYTVWGSSQKAMAGGHTGSVKLVTADDIQNAKESLTQKLLARAAAELKSKLSSNQVLLDGALSQEITGATSTNNDGDVAEKFTETAQVKVTALVFTHSDLEQLVKDEIAQQLPSNKDLLDKSLKVAYTLTSCDANVGKEVLNVQFSSEMYAPLDKNLLIDQLAGKTSDGIKQVIAQSYGGNYSDVKVGFWPFWTKKAPTNKNHITINLRFPQ